MQDRYAWAQYTRFNLNQMCRAKITDAGWEVFKAKYGEAICQTRQYDIDDDGYSYFQLWDFMNTFGTAMRLGAAPPVEGNVIEINLGDL